jgi:hypothetical protein
MLLGAMALVFAMPAQRPALAQSGGEAHTPTPVAVGDRIYCAGFVSEQPIQADTRIVGSLNEVREYFLVNNAHVYMNKGKAQGVQVGEIYHIVRPVGPFYHPFKNRSYTKSLSHGQKLGYMNEEYGFARVIAVQDNTATLEITEACAEARLGDALVKYDKPQIPEQRAFTPLDPLSVPTGKTTGQIIYARHDHEQLTASDVVILDIGEKAGVKVGDYFTIFREQGSDGINTYRDDETAPKRSNSDSDRFHGNPYSILHPSINKEVLTKKYPGKVLPRTVVGELVVTRVEGTTATAIITRTQNGEVYVGDHAELQ